MAKTAIITGGSRGSGAAMSLKLGELGYNVVINYRSESSTALSDKIASEIESKYHVGTLLFYGRVLVFFQFYQNISDIFVLKKKKTAKINKATCKNPYENYENICSHVFS